MPASTFLPVSQNLKQCKLHNISYSQCDNWWLVTICDIRGKSQEHKYSWRQSKPPNHASVSKPWSNQPQIPAKSKEPFDKSTEDTVLDMVWRKQWALHPFWVRELRF